MEGKVPDLYVEDGFSSFTYIFFYMGLMVSKVNSYLVPAEVP